ncbi:hypothetical protein C8J57DRAFT_1621124 [Mycena rebaudengoi]|nr:hypothetical protein C8J57DRAFT_1621124 [Mycena rebaudengoi]
MPPKKNTTSKPKSKRARTKSNGEDYAPAAKKTASKRAKKAPAKKSKAAADHNKDYEEEDDDATIVTILKLGRAPVDVGSGIEVASHQVYNGNNEDVWDAMRNQTSIGDKNNKFYTLQLLHPTSIGNTAQYLQLLATPKEEPLESHDLLRLSLTQDELSSYLSSSLPWFEKLVTGTWVRYLVSSDQDRCKVYRLYEIKGVGTAEKLYQLGDYMTRHVLELKHGAMEVMWPIDRVSNSGWSEVALPTHKDIDDRHIEKQEILSRHITEKHINKMLAQKRKIGAPLCGTQSTRLRAEHELALRLGDHNTVRRIDARLRVSSAAHQRTEGKDLLALVNEWNRTANMEAVRKAERLEVERKWSIRGVHMMPTVAADTSRESKSSPTTTLCSLCVTSPQDKKPLPSMKLNPGKTLIEQCIESIKVDLGDF